MNGRLRLPWARMSVAAFSVAVYLAVPAWAQATDVSPATLTLAWAELGAEGLGPEYRDAAALVPRQLMATLSFVTERYPSPEEFEAATSATRRSGLEAARTAVSEARKRRDIAALSVRDSARRAADVHTADAALAKAEDALTDALAALEEPSAPSVAAVALRSWAEHERGVLAPASDDPATICSLRGVDLLVHGSVRLKGDYIAVDLALYVAVLGRDVWRATDYAFADGLDGLVAAFERPVAEAVIGKPYARAVFRLSPPMADLSLDGERFAAAYALFFEPGSHVAEARAEGYEKTVAVFDVTPGADAFIDLELAARDSVGFALSSEPPGAAVHLDGSLTGYAPLDLPGAAYPRVVRISMPGFEDVQLVVRPESPERDRVIALDPADGSTFDERFDEKKTAFYHSLGWFVVSLPVTVISGGLFQTYYQSSQAYAAAGGTDTDVIDKLNKKFYTSQAAFWVSASVSTGLAAWAIARLASYIGAAR